MNQAAYNEWIKQHPRTPISGKRTLQLTARPSRLVTPPSQPYRSSVNRSFASSASAAAAAATSSAAAAASKRAIQIPKTARNRKNKLETFSKQSVAAPSTKSSLSPQLNLKSLETQMLKKEQNWQNAVEALKADRDNPVANQKVTDTYEAYKQSKTIYDTEKKRSSSSSGLWNGGKRRTRRKSRTYRSK